MTRALASILLVVLTATTTLGASPAAPAPAPVAPSQLTLRFQPIDGGSTTLGSDAFVDFGPHAASPGIGQREIVIRRRVALHLAGPPGTAGSARVTVALGSDVPGCSVRVDGVTLSTFPRTIDAVHRIGTAVAHEIEVRIAADVPAGAFVGDLRWVAESF